MAINMCVCDTKVCVLSQTMVKNALEKPFHIKKGWIFACSAGCCIMQDMCTQYTATAKKNVKRYDGHVFSENLFVYYKVCLQQKRVCTISDYKYYILYFISRCKDSANLPYVCKYRHCVLICSSGEEITNTFHIRRLLRTDIT